MACQRSNETPSEPPVAVISRGRPVCPPKLTASVWPLIIVSNEALYSTHLMRNLCFDPFGGLFHPLQMGNGLLCQNVGEQPPLGAPSVLGLVPLCSGQASASFSCTGPVNESLKCSLPSKCFLPSTDTK